MRLSRRGQQEAARLGAFLARRPLSAIYTSPLLRARKTAACIAAAQPEPLRPRIDADLQEVKTGWQGEPHTALEVINWDFYTHPRHPYDDSLATIHTRMHRWLARALRRHAGSEIVGVSHGDPLLILVGALSGLPLDGHHLFPRPYIHTGALFRLRFDAAGALTDATLLPADLPAAALSGRDVAA